MRLSASVTLGKAATERSQVTSTERRWAVSVSKAVLIVSLFAPFVIERAKGSSLVQGGVSTQANPSAEDRNLTGQQALQDLHHALSIEIQIERVDAGAEQAWSRSFSTAHEISASCANFYQQAHALIPSMDSAYRAGNTVQANAIDRQASQYLAQADKCVSQVPPDNSRSSNSPPLSSPIYQNPSYGNPGSGSYGPPQPYQGNNISQPPYYGQNAQQPLVWGPASGDCHTTPLPGQIVCSPTPPRSIAAAPRPIAPTSREAPPSAPVAGDPLLAGIGDGFKECGQAAQGLLLQVPVFLLTGNFAEAARLLGVQPGQSMVLKTLTQELNRPIIGTQQTPYQSGRRIGQRLCAYGIGGISPEHPSLPASPYGRGQPQVSELATVEQQIARRPSPVSFRGFSPDSVTRHRFASGTDLSTPELIGEAGMQAEAAQRGYWDLLPPGKAGTTPQGFDGIFWDSKTGTIVVGEAKGGYNGYPLDNILGEGYGKRQGTIDWAELAAQRITRATRTTNQEVRYAEQILFTALRDRKVPLRVEVFHTEINSGQPGTTRHYVTDSLQ